MTAKKLSTVLGVCALATIASAQPDRMNLDEPLFREDEWSFDAFGTLSIGQETINNLSGDRVRHDGRLGVGVGGNYFLSRNLGFGVEAYTESTGESFVDDVGGSVIYRFPFERAHLAPYVFGGGGRQFDPSEVWFAHAGGGLEVRITRRFGVFADARYVFTDETRNFGLGRLGARVSF